MNSPTPTAEQIETLRDLFLKKIDKDGAPCEGGFHPKDIERAKTSDRWIQLFLEQTDLDMKQSLKMLWETCTWRKTYGTNDIDDIVLKDYLDTGIIFSYSSDKDGKSLLILKSKLHTKGTRDVSELIKCLVYWIERLHRGSNYDQITLFFDMQGSGLSNMDMDLTRRIIDTFKYYYPNSLNYIVIFEMPWVLSAAFKIIKSLLPPKAVSVMKFVNSKTMKEIIDEDKMLRNWGGTDDYEFSFVPEIKQPITEPFHVGNSSTQESLNSSAKKVHFANPSPPDSPMSANTAVSNFGDRTDGEMLLISPDDIITFTNSGTELIGNVDITNVLQNPVTYKIKTTSPEKFRVRPSTGVLAPSASTSISVVLQHGQETSSLSKDKFLVMCMTLEGDTVANTQTIAELWKNTPSNSALVEQHRLKCSIPPSAGGDILKNGRLNSSGYTNSTDADRQINHFSSSLSQINETTQRLESQVKFIQNLQWITLIVFLLLSIAVVYILKQEINSPNSNLSSKNSEL